MTRKKKWTYEKAKPKFLALYSEKERYGFIELRDELSKEEKIFNKTLSKYLKNLCQEGYLIKERRGVYKRNPNFMWAMRREAIIQKLEKIGGEQIVSTGWVTYFGLPKDIKDGWRDEHLTHLVEVSGTDRTVEEEWRSVNELILECGKRLERLRVRAFAREIYAVVTPFLQKVHKSEHHPHPIVNELTKRVLVNAIAPYRTIFPWEWIKDTKIDLDRWVSDEKLLELGSNLPKFYSSKEMKWIFSEVKKTVKRYENFCEETNAQIKRAIDKLENPKGFLFVYDLCIPRFKKEEAKYRAYKDLLSRIGSRVKRTSPKLLGRALVTPIFVLQDLFEKPIKNITTEELTKLVPEVKMQLAVVLERYNILTKALDLPIVLHFDWLDNDGNYVIKIDKKIPIS